MNKIKEQPQLELQDTYLTYSGGKHGCAGYFRAKGVYREFKHDCVGTYHEAIARIKEEAKAFERITGVDTMAFEREIGEYLQTRGYVDMPGRSVGVGKRTLRSFYNIRGSGKSVPRPDRKYDDWRVWLDYSLN